LLRREEHTKAVPWEEQFGLGTRVSPQVEGMQGTQEVDPRHPKGKKVIDWDNRKATETPKLCSHWKNVKRYGVIGAGNMSGQGVQLVYFEAGIILKNP
jgi:hypothetical protein